jgi:hypothetical protein
MKSASANLELVDQDSGVPLERKSQVTALSSVLKLMAFIFGTNQPRLKFAIRLFEPGLPLEHAWDTTAPEVDPGLSSILILLT